MHEFGWCMTRRGLGATPAGNSGTFFSSNRSPALVKYSPNRGRLKERADYGVGFRHDQSMNTDLSIDAIRPAIIGALHPEPIAVFGSVARGRARMPYGAAEGRLRALRGMGDSAACGDGVFGFQARQAAEKKRKCRPDSGVDGRHAE